MPKKQKHEKDFLDELMHFTVHEHEFKQLTIEYRTFLEQYRDMEFYPNGLYKGKPFDKVEEAKRLIRAYRDTIKRHKGVEDNEECMILGQLLELFDRMMAHQFRKLKLEKLL